MSDFHGTMLNLKEIVHVILADGQGSIPVGWQWLIGLHPILPSSGSPPRAAAKGDQHLDGLEKSSEAVPLPGSCADWALTLAEIGIEDSPPVSWLSHLADSSICELDGPAGRQSPGQKPGGRIH